MNQSAALFFPYTRIREARLKRALAFCNRIILYQLPVSQGIDGQNDVESAEGLIWQPVDFFKKQEELKAILGEFHNLSETHRDRESLAAFRTIVREKDVEQAGSRLMSAVRQASRQEDPEVIADRSAQILLHFLEDLDFKQAEVNGLMARVAEKEIGLSEVMGVDHDRDDALPLDSPDFRNALTAERDDPFMLRRLAAWARLYKTFGPHDAPLLTDSAGALSELDTGLARQMGGPGSIENRAVDALEPVFSVSLINAELSPTDARAFEKFTARLLSRAWGREELDELRAEGVDLFGPIDRENTATTLTAFLMPGQDLVRSFLAGAGVSSDRPDPDHLVGPLLFVR